MLFRSCMNEADEAIVYFNPHTIAHKKLPPISIEEVKNAFNRDDLKVYTDSTILLQDLKSMNWKHKNLLMMSSGNFDGINFNELANQLIN